MNKFAKQSVAVLSLFTTLSAMPALADNPLADRSTSPVSSTSSSANPEMAAANNLTRNEAMKLLIYTSLLSYRMGEVVEVSPAIQAHYNTVRTVFLGSIPTGVVAFGTGVSAKQSAEQFVSVLSPITAVVTYIARAIGMSSEQTVKFLEEIGFNHVLEASGRSSEAAYKLIEPSVKLLSTKGFGVSMAALTGSGVFGTSVYSSVNSTAQAALTSELARSLLGYNKDLKTKLDSVATDLSAIFPLGADDQAVLKDALTETLVSEAVKTKFDPHATYHANVLGILEAKHLVGLDEISAARAIEQFVALAEKHGATSASDSVEIVNHVDVITSLCALLQADIESGKLANREDEAQARQLLGDALANLKRAQMNMSLLSVPGALK